MTNKETASPRIYRACLACYNNGRLIGEWIDATDTDAIEGWQTAHEEKTGHEEFAIHDYDDMVDLGEYPSLEDVAEWAALVEEHGREAVQAFIDYRGQGYAEASDFEDAYRGTYDSEKDFAYQFADDINLLDGVPESIQNYFDWDAWTRDLFIESYSSHRIPGVGVVVFDRNA